MRNTKRQTEERSWTAVIGRAASPIQTDRQTVSLRMRLSGPLLFIITFVFQTVATVSYWLLQTSTKCNSHPHPTSALSKRQLAVVGFGSRACFSRSRNERRLAISKLMMIRGRETKHMDACHQWMNFSLRGVGSVGSRLERKRNNLLSIIIMFLSKSNS
jgi:hypothetical protein